MSYQIGIIGKGQIGAAIDTLFENIWPYQSGSDVNTNLWTNIADDRDPAHENDHFTPLNVLTEPEKLSEFIKKNDLIVCAGPHNINLPIMQECGKQGKSYFDLTEDVNNLANAQAIGALCAGQNKVFVSQCGLAPGAVNIIAADMIRQFAEVRDVKIRVGALPKHPTNALKYNLSWSTEGLVNEYANDCQIIENGVIKTVRGLDGLESIIIDGKQYEAFYTSGGVGTLPETFRNVQNLDYKTIRYPGHNHLMRFLYDEMNLRGDQKQLVSMFNNSIPRTTEDEIIILIEVVGRNDANQPFTRQTYSKTITGQMMNRGGWLTAIQISTGIGIVASILTYLQAQCSDRLPWELWAKEKKSPVTLNSCMKGGFIRQEDIPLQYWRANTKIKGQEIY